MEQKVVDIMPEEIPEREDLVLATPSETNYAATLVNESSDGYCSFEPKNFDEKIALYKAVYSNPKSLKKQDGVINLKHIFVHTVKVNSSRNGETIETPRCVLIDDNMQGYSTVALGVYTSLRNLVSAIGLPDTWEQPIKVKVVEEKVKNGELVKLELV